MIYDNTESCWKSPEMPVAYHAGDHDIKIRCCFAACVFKHLGLEMLVIYEKSVANFSRVIIIAYVYIRRNYTLQIVFVYMYIHIYIKT